MRSAISLSRMGIERLDLVQFHWWDYSDRGYLDALRHLADLQHKGRIRHLGLTNFDTERLRIIADHGIRVVSNQVQYSLVDRRPEIRMAEFCRDHGMAMLAYGTLLGGSFPRNTSGCPEPGRSGLDTASLRKYKNMIDAWGGWRLFQDLLATLKQIADKHERQHRERRRPVHIGPANGRGRHHRRAARPSGNTSRTMPACSPSRSTATTSR